MSKEKAKKIKEPKFKEKLNVSTKPLSLLFLIAALVSAALRALQMAKYIDPKTGFYTGGELIGAGLYIILAVSAAVICVTSYLSADCAKLSFYATENKRIGAVTAVMAAIFLYDSADNFFSSFMSVGDINSANYTSFMKSGTIPMMIQCVFAFFSAVFFIILAKDQLKGTAMASKRRVLATAPVWWAGARLIHRFVRQISFIEVSDLLLELLMVASMLIFFMALAQVVTGVYSDGFRWRIFAFGYTASLLALTLSVPRLVFTFVGGAAFINPDHPFFVTDIAFAMFALTVILCYKPCQTLPEEESAETAH